MEARSKRWIALLGFTALVIGISLGVLAAGGGAAGPERANPPVGSGAGLKKIQKKLQKALDADPNTDGAPKMVDEAIVDKRKWIDESFGSQMVAGCNAGWLLGHFEAIDVSLEAAADPKNKFDRKTEIEKALGLSKAVAADVDTSHKNCPSPAQSEINLARTLTNQVDSLSSSSAPSLEDRTQIAARKVLFMGDDRVYGCAATEYLKALERIDVPLAVASDISDNTDEAIQLERRLIKEAKGAVQQFRRYWRKVPCEEGTGTTSTSTTSTGTGTNSTTSTGTTTTTPSQPACSDGADNDGDGKIDGADSGCLSNQDTTEQTNVWPYHYPGDGFSGFDWIDLKPFFGPFAGYVAAYRVFFGMTTVHMSTLPKRASTPINGTMPCPFLGPTGIQVGIGSAAPTGGGLPAAPDSDHMRIVIDTSDPAGGGDCGLGPVDLEVATDTRLP